MYYHDKKLQYPVRVDNPDPLFAKLLQQVLGGYEGELRVVFQYFFQAWNSRGESKYRDLLLEIGTEDLGHAEMFATAIAMNLEGSPEVVQEAAARDNPVVAAVMGGMSPRAFLSGGMGALAADSEGNPWSGSWVTSSGNIAADMFANVEGEVLNRTVAARLYEMTDDPGMKDMLRFLISRDTMHQQQWLAVIEELGGHQGVLPIPNSFPHDEQHETREYAYTFFSTAIDGIEPPTGRWTSGPSLDGKGEFKVAKLRPMGQEPQLAPPVPQAFAETQQMEGGQKRVSNAENTDSNSSNSSDGTSSEGIIERIGDAIGNVVDRLTGRNDHST